MPGSPHGANTHAEPIQLADYLPPGRLNSGRLTAAPLFLPADAPLPRGNLTQAMLDVLAVIGALLFLSVAAIGLVFSLFVLWFV